MIYDNPAQVAIDQATATMRAAAERIRELTDERDLAVRELAAAREHIVDLERQLTEARAALAVSEARGYES